MRWFSDRSGVPECFGSGELVAEAIRGESTYSTATFKANGPISGSATVIDGVVYFATLTKNGHTYALDARTGRLLWSFPDGRYTPVVADKDHLYLVGYATLYAFAPR